MVDPLKIVDKYSYLIPVPVFDILNELGLGPDFQSLDDNVSGWIERTEDDNYSVVLNSRHPLVRQRFTAAHELGHFLYHRDLLGAGVGDTRAYRADASPLPNAKIRPVHERQANSFAANLLMPERSVNLLKQEGVEAPRLLADRLGVSEPAMRIRLGLPAVA